LPNGKKQGRKKTGVRDLKNNQPSREFVKGLMIPDAGGLRPNSLSMFGNSKSGCRKRLFAREMREKTQKKTKKANCFHFAPVERANLLFSKHAL
jgi:hypothetical protein